MVHTHGLSHIALAVRDPDRSLASHSAAFWVNEYYRDADTIQVQGPGPIDVIAFERRPDISRTAGGIIHFGFRLTRPEDIDAAVAEVEKAGGTITSRGEFAPGFPFADARDPDGYEIEIWYE